MKKDPNVLSGEIKEKLESIGYDGPYLISSGDVLISDFFRWVRHTHKYHHYIIPCGNHIHYNFDIILPSTIEYASLWDGEEKYKTYEEAEISCVLKLIEIINKNSGYIK